MISELKNFDNIAYNTDILLYTVDAELAGKEIFLKELFIYENYGQNFIGASTTGYAVWIRDMNNQDFYLTSSCNNLLYGAFDKLIDCPLPITVGDKIYIKKVINSGNVSVSLNITREE